MDIFLLLIVLIRFKFIKESYYETIRCRLIENILYSKEYLIRLKLNLATCQRRLFEIFETIWEAKLILKKMPCIFYIMKMKIIYR